MIGRLQVSQFLHLLNTTIGVSQSKNNLEIKKNYFSESDFVEEDLA